MTLEMRWFAIALLTLLACGCASTPASPPALHVVWVYEAEMPPSADDRPWWAKCREDFPGPIYGNCSAATYKPLEGEVFVSVTDTGRPLVLALTAYDQTHWKLDLARGVKIVKIVLGGYHPQRVSGQPSSTPIETYTYYPSPCERCTAGSPYFYTGGAALPRFKEVTGLDPTSIQGKSQGRSFSIFPGVTGNTVVR